MNASFFLKTSAATTVYFVLSFFSSSLSAREKPAPPPPETKALEAADVFEVRPEKTDQTSEKIIENFLEVSGGRSAYADIKTLTATGTLVEAHLSKTFKLIETHRGERHITYSWKHLGRTYKTIYAFDGVHIWKKELLPKEKHPERLQGPAADHFARQNWLLQPLVVPLRASHTFNYQGKSKVRGRTAYLISGFGKRDIRSWYYFDEETFLLTRWGGKSTLADIEEYIDYRATEFAKVDGVLLPRKIDILAENSTFGSITFDEITLNMEVNPTIFYLPQNKIPTLRQVIKNKTSQ